MSFFSSLNHVVGLDEKLRKNGEYQDPGLEHLRKVLPRDENWRCLK